MNTKQMYSLHKCVGRRAGSLDILRHTLASPEKLVTTNMEQWVISDNPDGLSGLVVTKSLVNTVPVFAVGDLKADDFPTQPNVPVPEKWANLPDNLLAALEAVMPAMSKDASRFVLNGVFFDKKCVVATDGKRLHIQPVEVEFSGFIVPMDGVHCLVKLLDGKGDCKYAYEAAKNIVWFRKDGVTLASRCVDANYPNYRRVIPDATRYLTFNSSSLAEWIKKSLLPFCRSVGGDVKECSLRLSFDGSTCHCWYEKGQKIEFSFPALCSGEQFDLALNAQFLLEALEGIEEDVEWMFVDNRTPICMNKNQVVIMPKRID